MVIEKSRVVVTQPQKGTFKCFTAVCTHQGCVVADVKNGTINCPCHGSAFKIADGSVANGPATRALRAVDIKVAGTDIRWRSSASQSPQSTSHREKGALGYGRLYSVA